MTDAFIGSIVLFAGNFAPRGWAFCQGQIISISQNTALFSILGTTYGGNGQTTFALPDLRGRAAVGQGTAPGGGTYTMGQVASTENVTGLMTQIPSHTHQLMGTSAAGTNGGPAGNPTAADTSDITDFYPNAVQAQLTPLAPNALANTGGTQPHPNLQPYLAMNYSIALQGLFPSRN